MADHLLKDQADFLTNGPESVPGQSLQEFHRKLKPLGDKLESATTQSWVSKVDGLTNGSGAETKTDIFIADRKMEITGIDVMRDGASANAATVAFTKNASTNVLAAASVDVDGLTDVTVTAATLTSTAADLILETGDRLKVAWVTDSAGTITAASALIKWKPVVS